MISAGRHRAHEIREDRNPKDHRQHADNLEQGVGQSHPPGFATGVDTGQAGGHAGADVGTENQGNTRVQGQESLLRQHDDHTGERARTLDQRREQRAHQDTEERILQPGQQVQERPVGAQRIHGHAHDGHAVEEHAEAQDDVAQVAQFTAAPLELQGEADGDHQQRVVGELEGDQLRGDGRADVRAQDHAQGLRERHQLGLHEAHEHDRGGAGALDDHGHQRSHRGAQIAVGRQGAQDGAHAAAGCPLQRRTHHVHAEEEQAQAAGQAEEHEQDPGGLADGDAVDELPAMGPHAFQVGHNGMLAVLIAGRIVEGCETIGIGLATAQTLLAGDHQIELDRHASHGRTVFVQDQRREFGGVTGVDGSLVTGGTPTFVINGMGKTVGCVGCHRGAECDQEQQRHRRCTYQQAIHHTPRTQASAGASASRISPSIGKAFCVLISTMTNVISASVSRSPSATRRTS